MRRCRHKARENIGTADEVYKEGFLHPDGYFERCTQCGNLWFIVGTYFDGTKRSQDVAVVDLKPEFQA